MNITILGCGGSLGVPSPGLGWGACNPDNPRNQRTRVSVLIQQDGFNLVIDAGPDIRQQLLREKVDRVDAVICTHAHADHTLGCDDLRAVMIAHNMNMPFYASAETLEEVYRCFGYLFTKETDLPQNRQQDYVGHVIEPGALTIGPIKLQVFEQAHGKDISLGVRIGYFAYSTDVNALNDDAMALLAGVKCWVVDCNNRTMDDSYKHSDLAQVQNWVHQLQVPQVYLTHLPSWHDYDTLKAKCPDGIEPAYDGLKLSF